MIEYDEIVYSYQWRVFHSLEELQRKIPYARSCTKRYRKYSQGYTYHWEVKTERIEF